MNAFYHRPGEGRPIMVVSANIGLGNPRFLDALCRHLALQSTRPVTGIFADDFNLITSRLSEKFLRSPHREKARTGDESYNTLEGYLRSRGELGAANIAKARLGTDAVFGPWAAWAAKQSMDVIGTQELPLACLASRMEGKDIHLGLYIADTIEKPAVHRIVPHLDALWLTSGYDSAFGGYREFLPAYQKGDLLSMFSSQPITGTILPPEIAEKRGENYIKRWAEIDKVISGKQSLEVCIISSGSGINHGCAYDILGSLEGLSGVNINAIATQPVDVPLYSALDGRLVRNPNSSYADKHQLIDASYEMLQRCHLAIISPGELASICEALGIPFLMMKGRGFNELHNSQVYEGFCTGIPLPDASKVGQLIRCLVNPDDPQIYKFREEYQTDGYRARNGSPDKAYTLPSQGVTKLLESFI